MNSFENREIVELIQIFIQLKVNLLDSYGLLSISTVSSGEILLSPRPDGLRLLTDEARFSVRILSLATCSRR